jgi:hypothetical protein
MGGVVGWHLRRQQETSLSKLELVHSAGGKFFAAYCLYMLSVSTSVSRSRVSLIAGSR